MNDISSDDARRSAMIAALKSFKTRNENSQPAVRELLQRVAGVTAASEVPNAKVDAVIVAANATQSPTNRYFIDEGNALKDADGRIDAAKVFAKWNTGWTRPDRGGES